MENKNTKSPLNTNKILNNLKKSSKNIINLQKVGFVREREVRKFSKVGTPDYISPDILMCD